MSTEAIHVYSDGSGFDGHMGAAAVIYDGRSCISSLKYHLGTLQEHTVYEAEGLGTTLGFHLAMRYLRGLDDRKDVHLHIDNQPVMQAVRQVKPRPGHEYIKHL